jgi:hypothetical protein
MLAARGRRAVRILETGYASDAAQAKNRVLRTSLAAAEARPLLRTINANRANPKVNEDDSWWIAISERDGILAAL